jgi:hypothetical protein
MIAIVGVGVADLTAFGHRVNRFLPIIRYENFETAGLKLAAKNFLVDEVVLDKEQRLLFISALVAL